jgi:hypothetical protein
MPSNHWPENIFPGVGKILLGRDSALGHSPAMRRSSIRIGSGAGFSGDRIDPAVALAERGKLDYLVFECLAERTIALAVQAKRSDPEKGYDPLLEERLSAVLPAAIANKVTIISNMGAANPVAAARATAAIVRKLGLGPLKIAAVTGDDVLAQISPDDPLLEGGTVAEWEGELIAANAYLGAEPLARALAEGADIVITGRVADPSLFLAPMVHALGWSWADWALLGQGTVVGHLLECAGQVSGGYFADPGIKEVTGLADLGFPFADIAANGQTVISKLEGSGGCITLATCKEQLLYELHDPACYLTPDVTADFRGVRLEEHGRDAVVVSGGTGTQRPDRLKVTLGYHEGFMGEGQISYGGPGCVARAQLALAIVEERLRRQNGELADLRLDLIGVNSIAPSAPVPAVQNEVRARVAARTRTAQAAACIGREVEALYTNGPAGGGGVSHLVKPVIGVASTLLPRDCVSPRISWENVS